MIEQYWKNGCTERQKKDMKYVSIIISNKGEVKFSNINFQNMK